MGSKQRLQDKIAELEERWQRLRQKLSHLQAQFDRETRAEEELRSKALVDETKGERDQVEQELRRLESQRSGNDRYALTIRLQLVNNQLVRRYFDSCGKITEYRSPWHNRFTGTQDGAVFYEILFGPPASDQSGKVLRILCNSVAGVEPAPIRYSLRVRIHTTDPQLAALPWSQVSWQGRRLCDESAGWTFELTAMTPAVAAPVFPDVTLQAPCPVLMIAPQPSSTDDLDVKSHYQGLEERLHHLWPIFGGQRCQRVTDRQELQQALQQHKPRIVYYYGYADSDGNEVRLHLQGADGRVERWPVTSLAEWWGNHPPQVMFFNLIGTTPTAVGTAMARLVQAPPLLVTQTCAYEQLNAARQAALKWFNALLGSGEDVDPVAALQQHGLATAIAWGAFNRWRTSTVNEPPRKALTRLLLDRKLQRGQVHQAVSEMMQESDRRVCCVIAYGAAGNLVELFADQLMEYLRRHASNEVVLRKQRCYLPPGPDFNAAAIEARINRTFSLGPHDSLSQALTQRQPPALGRARPLLFLDWGVQGATAKTRISVAALAAWVEFCCKRLAAACPAELRLLSCLCLERPRTDHATVVKAIQELSNDTRFWSKAFRLEPLKQPLDVVEPGDLADFLNGRHSTCPEELFGDMPRLIVQQTHGEFEATINLLELADQIGWYELHADLCQASKPSADILHKDALL